MSNRLMATAAIATLFASTAFAQTSDDPAAPIPEASPGVETQSATPDWDASITDTFFEDEATGLVRSDEEIEERWQSLSLEEQARIRNDCASMSADAGATGTMDAGEGELDSASAADVLGSGELESDSMAGAMGTGEDTLESESAADVLGAEELETDGVASATLDSETTTGSTTTGDRGAMDVASFQQICSTVGSL